jgi:hypothetical protein
MIKDLLDQTCQVRGDRFDGRSRNVLLEGLVEKYFIVKDIQLPEMRKSASNVSDPQ